MVRKDTDQVGVPRRAIQVRPLAFVPPMEQIQLRRVRAVRQVVTNVQMKTRPAAACCIRAKSANPTSRMRTTRAIANVSIKQYCEI